MLLLCCAQAATGTCRSRLRLLEAAIAAVGIGKPPLLQQERASSAPVGIGKADGAGLLQNPGPANTVALGLVERTCLILLLQLAGTATLRACSCLNSGLDLGLALRRACCATTPLRATGRRQLQQ